MYFKRTTQSVHRCKNERKRCSYGRDRVGARRPAVLYDRHVAAIPRCSYRPGPGSFDGFGAPGGGGARLPRTAAHYVKSSRERLRDVKIPLLVVHARDDPLVSHDDCYDWADLVRNPRVVAVRTVRGGHNAWHEGLWPLGPSWAVGVATDYVSAVLEQTAQTGWLLAVLGELGHGPAPSAAAIARVAAATAHVLDAPAPPPPAPLAAMASDFSDWLFDEDAERDADAPPPPPPPPPTPEEPAARRAPSPDSDDDDDGGALGVYANSALYAF